MSPCYWWLAILFKAAVSFVLHFQKRQKKLLVMVMVIAIINNLLFCWDSCLCSFNTSYGSAAATTNLQFAIIVGTLRSFVVANAPSRSAHMWTPPTMLSCRRWYILWIQPWFHSPAAHRQNWQLSQCFTSMTATMWSLKSIQTWLSKRAVAISDPCGFH